MNNCYNCKNLTIKCRDGTSNGYIMVRTLDCKYCDMRIKNHATPCNNHEVGEPRVVWKRKDMA